MQRIFPYHSGLSLLALVVMALHFLVGCTPANTQTVAAYPRPTNPPSPTRASPPTSLPPSPTTDFLPRLSPGRYVAYWAEDKLWVQPIDGSQGVLWPPHGEIDPTLSLSIYAEDGRLHSVDLDSGRTEQIPIEPIDATEIFRPTWGLDLSSIAFAATSVQFVDGVPIVDEFPSIYILNTESHQATRLTPWDSVEVFPDWSPDGEWLAFSADFVKVRDYGDHFLGSTDIFAMRLDHASQATPPDEVRQLTSTGTSGDAGMPSWEPRGGRLAFRCGFFRPAPPAPTERQDDICILDLETLHVSNVTNSSDANETGPSWSSDSNLLGFTRESTSPPSGRDSDAVILDAADWREVFRSNTASVDEHLAYILDWPGD